MDSTKSKPKLLVIVGETASGKSSLAMRIAKEFDGEIISADSWTVYRHFDVGTAKSTITQQKAIKHHLIDVTEATAGFNAPKFKELAEKAVGDIQKRAKLPIIVGGTGLYIDSVLFDYGFLPDVSSDARQQLNAMTITELMEQAEAQNVDLTEVDTRNKRRIIRAIEGGGKKPTKKNLKKGTLIVGLQLPREELRKRVEKRTQQMINAGLEQEVLELSDKYGWDIEPMKGIGYREWREYFAGSQTLEQTKERIISSTMNLAKRQRTWFKRNRDINWFNDQKAAFGFIEKRLLNN